MSHYAGARNRLAKREAEFLVYAGPSQLRKAPSENALQKHLVGGLTAGGVKGGMPDVVSPSPDPAARIAVARPRVW